MAKSIDFWAGAGVDFDSKKALAALAAKVSQSVQADPDFFMDAPRLVLALATRPRTAEGKPESSVFQAFKGENPAALKKAGVRLDEKTVTFTGFNDTAQGMADLDGQLRECGALRRTSPSHRSKGWAFISDPILASTPKLAPGDRVGALLGAKQISIALPPRIASALPSWASASAMVGFFCECGRQGVNVADLEAFLQAKRDDGSAHGQRWSYPTNNASNNDNNPNNDPNNNPQEDTDNDNNPNNDNDNDNDAE